MLWKLNSSVVIHTSHHFRDSMTYSSQGTAFFMAPTWWSCPHGHTPLMIQKVFIRVLYEWRQSPHIADWWTDVSYSFNKCISSLLATFPPYFTSSFPPSLAFLSSILSSFLPSRLCIFSNLGPLLRGNRAWMFFRTNDINSVIWNTCPLLSATISWGVFFILHFELL